MTRSLTFDYDHAYYPAAPQVEITVDGYDPDYVPVTLFVFADSGADGTMLPRDVLEAVGAEYADTVILRGTAGVFSNWIDIQYEFALTIKQYMELKLLLLDEVVNPFWGETC